MKRITKIEPQIYPQIYIDQFWAEVLKILRREYKLQKTVAQKGIQDYQEAVRSILSGIIYNQGEKETARVIARKIENGL